MRITVDLTKDEVETLHDTFADQMNDEGSLPDKVESLYRKFEDALLDAKLQECESYDEMPNVPR